MSADKRECIERAKQRKHHEGGVTLSTAYLLINKQVTCRVTFADWAL